MSDELADAVAAAEALATDDLRELISILSVWVEDAEERQESRWGDARREWTGRPSEYQVGKLEPVG